MKFEINSYNGVGLIRFGMLRDEVRIILSNYEYREFKRNSYAESPTDGYDDLGLNIYYDSSNEVEALEFCDPASVLLENIDMLNKPAYEVYDLIKNLDKEALVNEDGLISFKLGVSLYDPFYEEDDSSSVESVIVFKKGYYDSIDFN